MIKFADLLQQKALQANYQLSAIQIKQFTDYYHMLIETNKHMNLTAITEPEEVIVKHFIDSLSVYDEKYFKPTSLICDLGTGAGFPGIPLKIWQPDSQIVLLDSLAKRLNFLNNVIKELNLNHITTCHMRAEDAGRDMKHREKYDIVIARAVAPMVVLAEYCLPLAKVGGYFIAMKGKNWQEEISTAKNALTKLNAKIVTQKQFSSPGFFDERAVIYLRKDKKTMDIYPRKAGTLEKQPLI